MKDILWITQRDAKEDGRENKTLDMLTNFRVTWLKGNQLTIGEWEKIFTFPFCLPNILLLLLLICCPFVSLSVGSFFLPFRLINWSIRPLSFSC